MKLNLGCSDALLAGWVNVDRVPPADQLVDLSGPWPWSDSIIESIRAHDIIEHLPDKVHTMNEAYRVLRPGGQMEIKVPTTDGPGAWQDPTHVSFWNAHSFWYFDPGQAEWKRFHAAYGITAKFRIVSQLDTKYNNGVVDLRIVLEALK